MKYSSQGLIVLILLCLVGCKSDNTIDPVKSASSDKRPNPFVNCCLDSLFREIDYSVDSIIISTNLEYDEHTVTGYMLWDSIANALYAPENFVHSCDVDWEIIRNRLKEYLNQHLWRTIRPLIKEQSIVELIEREKSLSDSLLNAQYSWMSVHFDNTQEWVGSGYRIKYYSLEYEMLSIQNSNLIDLLGVITDTDYKVGETHDITDGHIQKALGHVLNEVIPYYINDSIYNANADRNSFKRENSSWSNLMNQRRIISNIVSPEIKRAYDMGTYRLMFNRLRQLKNEFEAYDLMSNDMRSLLELVG